MFKKNINKKLKGSGIVVVIFSAIAFSIYVSSTYSSQEHFSIMQNKYEKNITNEYEKNYNNIEDFYESIIIQNSLNQR